MKQSEITDRAQIALEKALAVLPDDIVEKMGLEIDELEKSREANPMLHIVPHKVQEEFLRLCKRQKFMFGSNSSGKSFIGCYECACYLMGRDPLNMIPYDIPQPRRKIFGIDSYTKVWLGTVKMDKGVDIVRQNLIPLLPPGKIQGFNETRGTLRMKNGATLQIMSYDQEVEKWQSDAVDFIMFDEQPPKPHYHEGLARIARRNGRVICTVTPLYRNAAWLYWEIYRNIYKNTEVGYVIADIEDNVYLDENMKKSLYMAYKGTKEEAARLHGRFLQLLGAVHTEFDHDIHVIDPFEITEAHKDEYEFARVFDLHPRSPNVCSWFMYKKRPPVVYLVREYKLQGEHIGIFADRCSQITAEMGVRIKMNIIDSPDPRDMKQQGSSLVNDMAKKGITGMRGNRDLSLGIKRLDEYLRDNKIFIFRTCEDHIFSIENYKWDEWRGSYSSEKEPKEKPVNKDDHWVRNIHYMLCYLPSLDEDMEILQKIRAYNKYENPSYALNYHR